MERPSVRQPHLSRASAQEAMKAEQAIAGVTAAPGIAVGRAMVADPVTTGNGQTVLVTDREAELVRALAALTSAASELESIAGMLRKGGRTAEADIVETGILMAQDPELHASVERLVESGLTAPAALRDATDQSAAELARLDDQMLAERADDIRSLGRRAAAQASGARRSRGGGVLVADTLGPADVAELSGVIGVALARGGVTAHAAIVARSLGLPRNIDRAIDVALSGETRTIDLGRATYRLWSGEDGQSFFANVASAGMSGAIAQRANDSTKALGGKVSYLWATFAVFARWSSTEIHVTVDVRADKIAAIRGKYAGTPVTAGGE